MARSEHIDDHRTFAELGIPFPLYEGPVSSASNFVGRGRCAVTGKESAHCFEVRALVVACSSCGARTAGELRDDRCHACGADIPAHAKGGLGDGPLVVSYEVLRRGEAAGVVDTELGMVTAALALQGRTHGVPDLTPDDLGTNDFQLDPPNGDGWVRARVPSPLLVELVTSPIYSTWQGETWLFHCGRPMVFIGEESSERLASLPLEAASASLLESLTDDGPVDEGLMTFRCAQCGLHRFHHDCD